jgi:tripartite-type tricarboxylate transporter receptor subunit TctC
MDFAGKTIKIVIPYGPGGTYDKYGVVFSNNLGKHIPGNPNIILQHMPGAGGAKAMNWVYNVALPRRWTLDWETRTFWWVMPFRFQISPRPTR